MAFSKQIKSHFGWVKSRYRKINVNLFSTGSQDGRVHVWGSDSGQKLTVLEGNHPGPIQCVGFNPKYMMLASACTNMVS